MAGQRAKDDRPLEPGDKLYFYSGSSDAPPGKGANEVGDPANYTALAHVAGWRKVLSNFHVAPFEWRGFTWNSIEHVFQGMKIGLQDNTKAAHFTLDSGHFIGQGNGAVAQKHRKYALLTQENIERWSRTSDSVMHSAAQAKYSACPLAAAVLDATGDAELWHIVPRSKYPTRFHHLETIRAKMREPRFLTPLNTTTVPNSKAAAREARALMRAEASDERNDDGDDAFFIRGFN